VGLHDFEVPRRVMAIAAHPDDIDFGASGTMALLAAKGAHITYCVATSGQKGTHDPRMTSRRLARIREDEQRAAGRVVGAREFVFLRYQDGETEAHDMKLRGDVCRAIREAKPDAVFCPDPWREYQTHPDHRNLGWAGLDGVIAARDHLFFPEQLIKGLTHHRVHHVYMWGTNDPNTWFDITGTLETKVRAILSHTSQIPRPDEMRARMNNFARFATRWGFARSEAFRYLELA